MLLSLNILALGTKFPRRGVFPVSRNRSIHSVLSAIGCIFRRVEVPNDSPGEQGVRTISAMGTGPCRCWPQSRTIVADEIRGGMMAGRGVPRQMAEKDQDE